MKFVGIENKTPENHFYSGSWYFVFALSFLLKN